MTAKSIPFKQPTAPPATAPQAAETWVDPARAKAAAIPPAAGILSAALSAPEVPTSRMTFDVPKSLHMRFKMQCLRRDKPEYEIGTAIMERAVAELEKE
jgi:hypothetical protein